MGAIVNHYCALFELLFYLFMYVKKRVLTLGVICDNKIDDFKGLRVGNAYIYDNKFISAWKFHKLAVTW